MATYTSVAMATYNGAKFIQAQLDSLAAQKLPPHELIVTDDGSTDGTPEIVEVFAGHAPFSVSIHRNSERLGYTGNFLKAAGLCSGELIAFCDQDDVWLPEKLARCAAMFDDPEVLIVGHTSRIWYGGEQFGGHIPHFTRLARVPREASDPLRFELGFSTVFRREILSFTDNSRRPPDMHDTGDPPKPMAHDEWVWFLASIFGTQVELPDELCWYRQHGSNVFGAAASKTAGRRLFADKSAAFRERERITRQYAEFIEGAFNGLPPERRAQAAQAAARLNRRADLYRLRAKIYSYDSSFLGRSAALRSLMLNREYVALERRALPKDVMFGLSGAFKVLRSFGK